MFSLLYIPALNIRNIKNKTMILENSSLPNRDNQIKEIEKIKNIQKERFKIEDKSFLNDSEFIENYNNVLKSPQSRRLYKNLENNDQLDKIKVQDRLPLDKISFKELFTKQL